MYRVTEFNSLDSLKSLRGLWSELLPRTRNATFFHTSDWLQTFWQFYGQGNQLRVLLVEDGDGPVGILPLAVMRESMRLGSVRVLGYPLNGWGSFYSPIGVRSAETLAAGLRHVHDTPRTWDLLDLRWVNAEDAREQNICGAMSEAGFKFESQVWHSSAQIEIAAGWEQYWSARRSTWRNNVRRCEKRLARHGEIEYLRYRPAGASRGEGNPHWDLYDACVGLAERSWQGASTTGTTLSHASVREYLRAAHEAAARAGGVDLNLLLLAGKPVAFAYNNHFQGSVYGVRSGYDAAVAKDGSGTVLMGRMIEDSCRRGDRLIDLGPNYLENKRFWLTRLQPALHYTVFNPVRLRAQSMRLKRFVKRCLGGAGSMPIEQPIEEIAESSDWVTRRK